MHSAPWLTLLGKGKIYIYMQMPVCGRSGMSIYSTCDLNVCFAGTRLWFWLQTTLAGSSLVRSQLQEKYPQLRYLVFCFSFGCTSNKIGNSGNHQCPSCTTMRMDVYFIHRSWLLEVEWLVWRQREQPSRWEPSSEGLTPGRRLCLFITHGR